MTNSNPCKFKANLTNFVSWYWWKIIYFLPSSFLPTLRRWSCLACKFDLTLCRRSCLASSFLLSFLPKLGEQNFVGPKRKFSTLFSFSLVFSLEPNKGKFHFPPYFPPLILFHPHCFHPNQKGLRERPVV